MKWKWSPGVLAACSLALLNSCSGLGNNGGCTTNCGGGNANLTISLYDTPPAGTSILSFTLPIAGISLTPTTGTPVPIPTTVSSAEVTHLQTDSTVIVDQTSVKAGSYNAIGVTIGPTSATNNLFINTSGSTIFYGSTSCLNDTVCALPVGAIFTVSIPLTLTLSANQNQWIGLNFNLNKAITSTGGISVDFSQPGVLTATTTPEVNTPSGSVDLVEDVTGVVTALSSTSITVKSDIAGTSLTAGITSSTEIDLAPVNYSKCKGTASACLTIGSTVSLNTDLSPAGTFTVTEIDVLDAVAVDEVEGTIVPTTIAGVVELIIADKTPATSSSALSASTTTYGTPIFLTTLNSTTYSVDTGTLSSLLTQPVVGFSGSGSLLAGQRVRVQVSNLGTDGSGNLTASANNALLRWSRLSGTVNSVTNPAFTIANLQPYIAAYNVTLSTTPQVNTYQTLTIFQGTTGVTDSNFLGAPVSIRALYLDSPPAAYPFQAAKVRVH